MLGRGPYRTVLLFAASLLACGPSRSVRRDTPRSPLDLGEARPAPVIQKLRVVALADARYRRVAGWRDRIGDRLDSVADQFAVRFGLQLEVLAVTEWAATGDDLDVLLASLEESGPHPRADLVMAFSAAPPPRRARMPHLVRAAYAGRYVVARSQTTYFRPAQTEALHHAEVRALMQGVALVFGAVPDCPPSLMATRASFRPLDPHHWRWTPLNLALIRAHSTLDLRRPGRVPADIAEAALDLLARSPGTTGRCEARALTARKTLLGAVLQAANTPEPLKDDTVELGRAALEAGNAARAFDLCDPVAARAPDGDAPLCAASAAEALERWPDAVRNLRAHLAHHPDDEPAVLRLAKAVGRDGDDEAARALLRRYVTAHPDHLRARLNLGVAHARLGEYDAARTAWQAVLGQDPDNVDARDLLGQLPHR